MSRRWFVALGGAALMAGAAWIAGAGTGTPVAQATATAAATRARQFWPIYERAGQARSAGRLEDAIALYTQALVVRPEHEDSLYYLGNCLLERRDHDGALRVYERLVAANPAGSSRGYMQLGSLRASLDPEAPVDLPKARALFEHALALDPDSGALLGLAEVALLEHQLAEAARLLASVEADNPMSVAAPYLRGYLAFARDDAAGAWALFKAATARGEFKKAAVRWTEEGDAKTSPELRWRALARQSVFGAYWIPPARVSGGPRTSPRRHAPRVRTPER